MKALLAVARRRARLVAPPVTQTDAAHLRPFIDAIRRLRQRGLLGHRTEIMAENDPRLRGRLTPGARRNGASWGTWGAIYGDPPLRRLLCDALRGALKTSCRAVTFFDQDSLEGQQVAPDVMARLELARGVPSNYSIQSMPRAPGAAPNPDLDLDDGVPGMLAVLPAVPLVGECFQRIVDLVNDESAADGVQPVMSFSTVSEVAAEGFIRAHFDRRDPKAVDRVHRWARRLDVRLRAEGLPLLRLNIGQMEGFAAFDDIAGRCLNQLGRAFDPKRIMAPGRYARIGHA